MEIKGKCALITGGSRVIGRETAVEIAKKRWKFWNKF